MRKRDVQTRIHTSPVLNCVENGVSAMSSAFEGGPPTHARGKEGSRLAMR